MSTESSRWGGGGAGGAVRFRHSAWTLAVVPAPIVALWLWEAIRIGGGVTPAAPLTAARLTMLVVPFTLGAIFSFGVARDEPDARLAAAGLVDLRRVWLLRWTPFVTALIAVGSATGALLGVVLQQPAGLHAVAAAAVTVMAMAISFSLRVWVDPTPAVGAASVAAIGLALGLGPALLGAPPWLSATPWVAGWAPSAPNLEAVLIHATVLTLSAGALVAVALHVPSDIVGLRWFVRRPVDAARN